MLKKLSILLLLLSTFTTYLSSANTHYVNTLTLKVRTAPTSQSSHSYSIYKGQRLKVYETKNNWARISKYITTTLDGTFIKAAKWVHTDFVTPLHTEEKLPKIKEVTSKEKIDLTSNDYYVNARVLKVRSGPSTSSQSVGKIYKAEKVKAFEFKDNWARISTENTPEKWVYRAYLTKFKSKNSIKKNNTSKPTQVKKVIEEVKEEQKVKPVIVNKQEEGINPLVLEAISNSNDFKKFKPLFISTSKRLYDDGICRLRDFRRAKGWMEAVDETIYFIYCGSIKRSNKIYLNVITEKATK